MANDGLRFVLILIQKLLRTTERNLIDVFVHLFGCHANTVVTHRERLFVFINGYAHACVTEITFHLTDRRQCLQFSGGIYGIANQLTQENLVI